MWPGIDPLIWKHVSRWLFTGLETLNNTIDGMNMIQFGAVAAVIVSIGFYFMFAKRA